ncbi:DEAD/DEAH box helicase [Microvirga guangxiensis]|uniref:Helicase conserved C-terminal domain-containing protein n=1 Tax=Microvirga guangxiensis TaxID=549386 RepID=A0A1G5F5F9_9HYPH|nr:helicase-related protein [Microvirga guangxiensis]SCY34130.1 Helicase conserved C-terminal domain-containing protein [Microvirga guangxiensis]
MTGETNKVLDAIGLATNEIARFLEAKMPGLSEDWWQKHVVDRLSFQQQRTVIERGHKTLRQLDFAALLRVLDQNWYELSNMLRLPREGRTWVKELQTVRNKWAHLSSETMPASEVYRDADTLGRLLGMIGADSASLELIESVKSSALATMADAGKIGTASVSEQVERSDSGPASASDTAVTSFKVGDLVALRSNPNIQVPVLEVLTGGPETRYRVFQNNAKATYYESQLQAVAATEGERAALTVLELHAHLTALQILSPSTANLFSLRSGRVQFVPYQYRPVLKLIRADRPRLLIADEVGVGKTIEAGLIVKELRARMDISSVLVICPKALVAERKWHSEMKRFDEHFTALDGPLLRHCLKETDLEGEWPEQYAKAILPFSLFDSDLVFGRNGRAKKRDLGLLDLNPPPQFDLVIVDEAHHIRNSETFLHQGVRYFCDNAKAVVLLTATPVQLGSEDLFTLLNVLRPDLVIDHASFEQIAEPNRYINAAVQQCRAAKPDWQEEARKCLEEVARTEWGRLFLRESPAFQAAFDKLQESDLGDADRVGLTRSVEELYTFSPLINRTRRRDIGEFTTRKPETVTVDFTPEQSRLHDGLLDVIARILARCHGQQNVKFMMTTIRRQAASCLYGLAPLLSDILSGKLDQLETMEASDSDADVDLSFLTQVRSDIQDLLEQARTLDPRDEKVEAFVRMLTEKSSLPNNKALVFSTFRHTLRYLAEHTERAGLKYGLVHGDIPDDERAELRRRFALPKEDADALDILLSSEVGCEGLDFQFCDFLINYDLPWNPMKIEQRIGRIDRYGQKSEAVAIINFITPGTVDADIYQRCLWRIGVFQHAVGGSEEILGEITRELHDIADSFTLTAEEREHRLQQLADNGIRRIREEQELESKQSELFGLNVPTQSWREEIAAAETYWLSPAAIQRCVTGYLAARLGGEGEHLLGEKPLKTLRLSQEARTRLLEDFKLLPRSIDPVAREWEKWLKGGQPLLPVTFEQEIAAENPKAVYLTVLHPLVRQAAAYLDFEEASYCTLAVQSDAVPPGIYNFALYRWTKHGIKPDESLVAVADHPQVEDFLFELLQAGTGDYAPSLPEAAACDGLDVRHHAKWSEAQANHMAQNRELADHRIQSLTASHRARCKAIEDQVMRATNDKIRLMKESELARANVDFNRRLEELGLAAASSDIRSAPIVFGTIAVTRGQAA